MNPIQRPDSIEAADYVGVLRRRWWIVVALTIFGVIGAFAYTVVASKTYTATVNVSVTPTAADATNNTAANSRTSGSSVNLDTEAQVVTFTTVAAAAGKAMHSALTPWQLSHQIAVTVPPNSSVLTIACQAPTATGAAACANAFAAAYLHLRDTTATSAINAQLSNVQHKITTLNTQASQLNTKISSLPSNSSARNLAQQQLNSARRTLSYLGNQEGVLTNELGNLSGGQILTHATPPGKPTSPKKSLVLPAGLVAGLLLGFIAAFIVNKRDKKLHTAKDVERTLDLPVLLDLPNRAFSQHLSLASPRSRTGHAFTELAHAVTASLGEGSHVVAVAGTTPSPAGSVIAANLAATLARTQGNVVLVCAKLDDTVANEVVGVDSGRGLAEVLAGMATVSHVAREPVNVPGLWVIPPGTDPSLAVYHMQHDKVHALTAQLRKDARYIVIDVQATEEGADTFALAEFADAALLTIEIPRTTRPGAAECIRRLQQLRTPILGAAVLSAVRARADVRPPRAPQPRLGAGESGIRSDSAVAGRGPREASALSAPLPDKQDERDGWPVRAREGHGDPAGRVPGT